MVRTLRLHELALLWVGKQIHLFAGDYRNAS